MREIVTLQAPIIFSFLRFHARRCKKTVTGRSVGPVVAFNGSNDAPRWRLRPFYGFVNKKNIFPYFTQNVKKCITPYGNFEQL